MNFSAKAVAATAAVALKFSSMSDLDRRWAEEVIFRAAESPEASNDGLNAESVDPYHVCFSVLQGLEFLVRENRTPKAKPAMIRLAAHPRRAISQAAIGAVLGFWKEDARFSWIGFDLAIRMSAGYWNGNREESRRLENENAANAIEVALARLTPEVPDFALTGIPPAWVFAPERPRRGPFGEEQDALEMTWRDPDIHLDHHLLSKLLRRIPFREILKDTEKGTQFLDFCKSLVDWTIEKLSPSWDTEGRRERSGTDLFKWKDDLCHFLGEVALYLELGQIRTIFLGKVLSLDDHEAWSLLHPFLDMLGRCIMDAPSFPISVAKLMQECLPKVLGHEDWALSRRRNGRLYSGEVLDIIRSLFFIQVAEAPNSARFANGNWSEVDTIIPIVDAVVMSVGDIPEVASHFLTLCERATANYPVEKFLDQTHRIFALQAGTPVGWRGPHLPSRIASLIQAFASRQQPLPRDRAQSMLRLLDRLVDLGDSRATALQNSELFRNISAS